MTKTIEEQIAEARTELRALDEMSVYTAEERAELHGHPEVAPIARLFARAESRLATLEAVRDGRMVAVYATVCTNRKGDWQAYGCIFETPDDVCVMRIAGRQPTDEVTILRGYAHVPSTRVHEVEADSEVPS